MKQTTYEKLLSRLDTAPVPLCKIAAESNVAQATVCRISRRDCKNPRVKTVDALLAWFDAFDLTSGVKGTVGKGGDVAATTKVAENGKNTDHNQGTNKNVTKRRRADWNLVRSCAIGKKAN